MPILGALRDDFKTEILAAGALAVGLAIVADGLLVLAQRAVTPWASARRTAMIVAGASTSSAARSSSSSTSAS